MIAMKKHNEKARAISKRLRHLRDSGKKVKIYHGSTNTTRSINFKEDEIVDISDLNEVIDINEVEKYIVVEPKISMEDLVHTTLKYNLIPAVVMEFPAITVGGGIQGAAGESSSFKYGLFHSICLEYEIVLGNGEIVICSRQANSDLFYGTAGSYGSLGVITLVKLQLIPAKKYVNISYLPTKNFSENIELTNKFTKEKVDFVDGLIFSKDKGVVIVGNLSDEPHGFLSTFRRATDEWFYIHAQKIASNEQKYIESVPLIDYLFRYDRGGFWMGRLGFKFLKVPFNRFTRFIFNVFMSTRVLYQSLHAANLSQKFIIQDICLPVGDTVPFLEFCDQKLGIYPLWVCPLRQDEDVKLSPNYINTSMVMNVGVWGELNNKNILDMNHEIERAVSNFGGRKILYAHTHYSEDKFWQIYDQQWYSGIREKYHAVQVFLDIYSKVRVKDQYKGSILKGYLNFICSPFRIPISRK